MTAVSIPSLPAAVPEFSGNPSLANDLATELMRASSAMDDFDTFSYEQLRAEAWTGQAADAYKGFVRRSTLNAATASLALRAGAKALWNYADASERLSFRHESLVEWRHSIANSVSGLRDRVHRASEDETSALLGVASDIRLSITRYSVDLSDYKTAFAANSEALSAGLASYLTLRSAQTATRGGDIADSVFRLPGAPGSGSTPGQVAAWWAGLTESQQFAVIAASPERIGAADGLPASVRDRANRLMLENDIEELDLAESRGALSDAQRVTYQNTRAAQAALEQCLNIEDATTVDPITGEPIPAFLLLYDPAGFNNDGAVAIAIGDPDTADNVSVSVPGIRTTGASAESYTEDARNLYESARLADPHSTTATIAWIGYDAPSDFDIGHTVQEGAAIAGGERLAQYVTGLQVAREGNPPHMTVIGHSYGSTTSAHAATDQGLEVDDLVLIGSPGAGGGVDHATDLGVPQVWAGNSSRDVVAALADNGWLGAHNLGGGGLGNDVAEDDFGAIRFRAEDESRATWYRNSDDHLKYYDRGTESCINLGEIVVGDDADVTRAGYVHDPWLGPPLDPEAWRNPAQTLVEKFLRERPDA